MMKTSDIKLECEIGDTCHLTVTSAQIHGHDFAFLVIMKPILHRL